MHVGVHVVGQGLPQQGQMRVEALDDVEVAHGAEALGQAGVVDGVLNQLARFDEFLGEEREGNGVREDHGRLQ